MKFKRLIISGTLIIAISLICTFVFADGKFLRNQKWKRFSVEKSKADFYVATNGNDDWSGTLPAPNELKNDGPFATVERAQEAVRFLKKRVYAKKKNRQ